MGFPELWQYFHKLEVMTSRQRFYYSDHTKYWKVSSLLCLQGNVCLQWTVPHPAKPDNQFKQVGLTLDPLFYDILIIFTVYEPQLHRLGSRSLFLNGIFAKRASFLRFRQRAESIQTDRCRGSESKAYLVSFACHVNSKGLT